MLYIHTYIYRGVQKRKLVNKHFWPKKNILSRLQNLHGFAPKHLRLLLRALASIGVEEVHMRRRCLCSKKSQREFKAEAEAEAKTRVRNRFCPSFYEKVSEIVEGNSCVANIERHCNFARLTSHAKRVVSLCSKKPFHIFFLSLTLAKSLC